METFVNEYYTQIEKATDETERARIKAEFAAQLQTFSEEQRQQVKVLVGKRLNTFLDTLAPVDTAIEEFNQYLKQRNSNSNISAQNAA